jgi:hypothetical protein
MEKKFLLKVFLFISICLSGSRLFAQTDVLTQHNDLARTGWNNTETQLKVSNVSNTSFGLIFKHTVDDQIYAQPLVVTGVTIGGHVKNVVYTCTLKNTVYAFDADNGAVGAYWSVNLTPANMRTPNAGDLTHTPCGTYHDFSNGFPNTANIGIVGTPVIDKNANTLFVVSRWADPNVVDLTNNHGNGNAGYSSAGFHEFLHALDLSTGADKIPPVEIQATVNGTAPGNVSGKISFDPLRQNQRGGLLLLDGVVYIPFASHCDWDNYHGWLFAYRASDLQFLSVFCSTPNDGRGGIWMSGAAPAAEEVGVGNIYVATGNSYNADPTILENRGESILKLSPDVLGTGQTKINIADYFTPTDYKTLNQADDDFGSQVMMVPNTNLLVTGAKDDYMYVLDKTNLGQYVNGTNHILQKFLVGTNAQFHSSLAYFGGTTKKLVYQFAENQNLSAYPVLPGLTGGLDNMHSITGNVQGGTGGCGSYMSVSSNGSDESTGILWISNAKSNTCNANLQTCAGILYAVNASDVTKLLWSSAMNSGDAVGNFAKTACPTVANGKVYLATFSNSINVYGLLASNPLCVTDVALNQTAVASSFVTTHTASLAFDNDPASYWQSAASDPQNIYVDLGASYDICKVSISWQTGGIASEYYLETTSLDPVANPGSWTVVDHQTGNTLAQTQYVGSFSGRYVRVRGISSVLGSGYAILNIGVYGQPSVTCGFPTGLTASSIAQNTAHISWNPVANAVGYNVAYNNTAISSQISRNNITGTSLNLTALSCGTSYQFFVQTICSGGQLSAFTPVGQQGSFNTAACTATCGALPTRHYQADIGDIGIAGSTCYTLATNDTTYTMQGSGKDIGGVDDEYQMMYFDLLGDDSYVARVTTQDATNPNNKAGIMMKQSLSNTAPFAYVGVTSGAGAFFMYRSTDGAAAQSVYMPGITAPYYLKLEKTGTQFAGFVSPTGNNDWVQIGSTVDLSFGSGVVEEGLAVTSADNTKLSTAVFDILKSSSVLPITLVSFTGQNINNQYVSLHWTTAMEENNDHFTIERSTDGAQFVQIASVKAVGNSSTNQNYSYSDFTAVSGVNFYRLRQVDVDGRMAVYPVIQVSFGMNGVPVIYPNPVKEDIFIASGKELVRSARLFNMEGREMMRTENNAGLQQISLHVSGIAAGVYMLEVVTDSRTYKQKVLKE